ncbi:MAG: hypothetical protein F4Z16_06480 [Rhodothermaceae bacterium]|nr:hypothetical protein [Rhodothermaceae bacterium]MYD66870.1 hypothetical protein [Rhodothermaceae bacterium]MYJ06456.1 hypothetical protein [Rhodothermaceae bacterium]
MTRILTLCVLGVCWVQAPAQGQTTSTYNVSVAIGLVAVYEPVTCSISATTTTINFPRTTSPRSGTYTTVNASTVGTVTVTGENVRSISITSSHPNYLVAGFMENSDGDQIPYTTLPYSCQGRCSGSTIAADATCTCSYSGQARVPVQTPAGSYTGTSTLTATCTQ